MGMFDTYYTSADHLCPRCGCPVERDWQSKEGPCHLESFYERQDEVPGINGDFYIYTYCDREHWVEARCRQTEGDPWRLIEVMTEEEAAQARAAVR